MYGAGPSLSLGGGRIKGELCYLEPIYFNIYTSTVWPLEYSRITEILNRKPSIFKHGFKLDSGTI